MLSPTEAATSGACANALVQSDFACIIDHALAEHAAGRGPLSALLGLGPEALERLCAKWFSGVALPDLSVPAPAPAADQEAIALLLIWRGGDGSEESRWLAQILARRAMEGSHLWEDLGLPDRRALGHLMARHFPRLAEANSRNMRWKKFFYRQICSDSEFALCLSPSCDDCPEKAECFAPDGA
jgi:nitrogen fixation protein NifQ